MFDIRLDDEFMGDDGTSSWRPLVLLRKDSYMTFDRLCFIEWPTN
jgi:hypothetical protein